MPAIGSVWASGSWVGGPTSGWATGTWAGLVPPPPPVIYAREEFSPPAVPLNYDPKWLQQFLGKMARTYQPVSMRTMAQDTTLLVTDGVLWMNGSVPLNVTLLPANQVKLMQAIIKNIGTDIVTLIGDVDGVTNPTIPAGGKMRLGSNGSVWGEL